MTKEQKRTNKNAQLGNRRNTPYGKKKMHTKQYSWARKPKRLNA